MILLPSTTLMPRCSTAQGSARAKAYGTHAPLATKSNTVGLGASTAKGTVKPNMADTQRVGRAEQAVPARTQGGKTFRCALA